MQHRVPLHCGSTGPGDGNGCHSGRVPPYSSAFARGSLMESRVNVLGHPAHQVLVPVPIGLLIGSVGMDLWGWSRDDPSWTVAAHRMMGIGVLAGMTAAPFGTIDWLSVPDGTRAKRIGAMHGTSALTALALFAGSWYLRRNAPDDPPLAARLLSFVALGVLGLTTWFGGEMVARLGVGVSPRAHLNAPSSLRTERRERALRTR
jgi:uncharacterized membrane protein